MRKALAVFFLVLGIAVSVFASQSVEQRILNKALKKFFVKIPKGSDLIVPARLKPSVVDVDSLLVYFKPERVLDGFPSKFYGSGISVVPVTWLFFLPFREYLVKWSRADFKGVYCVVLKDGVYNLDMLYRFINNPSILSRHGNVYTLHMPIFITPTASLVVKNVVLRLDINPGAPIFSQGKLYIGNAVVEAWDSQKGEIPPRKHLTAEDYYLYGKMSPRPYLLALRGGHMVVVNSKIVGLGYRGMYGTFGISISSAYSTNPAVSALGLIIPVGCSYGVFVGNDIYDNYMGFYSNRACGVVFVGNYVHDNLQYDFDPHDWSENVLVAYNIFTGTKKAHGLIFSRYVKGYVYSNICAGNAGAGIMMDRSSYAVVQKNATFGNLLGGIAIVESNYNGVLGNYVFRNNAYGIYVRNSVNILIKGNVIVHNAGSGVNIAIASLSYMRYRNLFRDPYRMEASAWVEGNRFRLNLGGDVKTHNRAAVAIFKNSFYPQSVIFSGDLKRFASEILRNQSKRPVIIYGYGNKKWIKKSMPELSSYVEEALKNIEKKGNPEAKTAIGVLVKTNALNARSQSERESYINCGEEWFLSAAPFAESYAILYLGVDRLLSGDAKRRFEGLILIAESAILGNTSAMQVMQLLPLFYPYEATTIDRAVSIALNRLKKGQFIECGKGVRCCTFVDAKKAEVFDRVVKFSRRYNLSRAGSYSRYFSQVIRKRWIQSAMAAAESIKKMLPVKNSSRKAFYSWYRRLSTDIKLQLAFRNPVLLRFFIKRLSTYRAWKELLSQSREKDFSLIEPQLERIIKKMNVFRVDKLPVSETINNLKTRYFYEGL